MTSKSALAFLRKEAVMVGATALAAVEASIASGNTVQVALQSALPLVLGAIVRQVVPTSQTTPTKENDMADLTALKQAVADVESAAQTVQATVSALRADTTAQADVDAVTAQVQQAAAALHSVA